MSDGRPKKNGSIVFVRERISQLPSVTTANRMRRVRTSWRCRRTLRRAAATPSSTAACARLAIGLRPLVREQDLVAEVLPDVAVQLDEARVEADLRHVPRPGQVYVVDSLHRSRTRGHDAHAVGKSNRLLEVVRDEHDGGGGRRPELE